MSKVVFQKTKALTDKEFRLRGLCPRHHSSVGSGNHRRTGIARPGNRDFASGLRGYQLQQFQLRYGASGARKSSVGCDRHQTGFTGSHCLLLSGGRRPCLNRNGGNRACGAQGRKHYGDFYQ